jgi:hypothetical protein
LSSADCQFRQAQGLAAVFAVLACLAAATVIAAVLPAWEGRDRPAAAGEAAAIATGAAGSRVQRRKGPVDEVVSKVDPAM